jgi:hypothetical protein
MAVSAGSGIVVATLRVVGVTADAVLTHDPADALVVDPLFGSGAVVPVRRQSWAPAGGVCGVDGADPVASAASAAARAARAGAPAFQA